MQPIRVTVLISGNGTNLEALLMAIKEKQLPVQVVQVISNRKEAYGLERAKKHRVPCRVMPVDAGENHGTQLLHWLEEASTDLVVLAGYLKKVPQEVLSRYENRVINIHPSLIPAFAGPGWYGMKVHEGVWTRGVKVTGATVHFVNGEMDAGPIILQEALVLEEDDQPADIQQKVLTLEHRLLPQAVAFFAAGRIVVSDGRTIIKSGVDHP